MKAFCGYCRFFEAGTTKAFPDAHGTCNRHAPRGTVIGPFSDARWSHFPPVNAYQSCGEHQRISFGGIPKRDDDLKVVLEARKASAA